MQKKRYEVLDGLPTYGHMYVPISEDGLPFYSEGYVVRFYNTDGTSWVANFSTGWADLTGIYDFPEFKRTIVLAFGKCYIMADDEQTPCKAFGVDFTNVYQPSNSILIMPGCVDMTMIDVSTDEVWRSERISWDGFENLNFSGDQVTGLAFDATDEEDAWKPFSFNYKTNEIIGGTFQVQTKRKPWWKIWYSKIFINTKQPT